MLDREDKETQSSESSPQQQTERRKIRRKIIRTRKTVLTEITCEGHHEKRQCYISINDFSESGMRITSDVFIPENTIIELNLTLEQPVKLEGRVAWTKEFGQGNHMIGLEFSLDSEVNGMSIPLILEWIKPYEVRHSLRPCFTRHFEACFADTVIKFYGYILVISPGGMEIKCAHPLPEGKDFTVKFSLFEKLLPISIRGIILFQKEVQPLCELDFLQKSQKIWIEFLQPDLVYKHIQEAYARGMLSEGRGH
ncbi:MAG: PilZ domain-containing protein [Vulcanimicrobiota bacterium]